MRLLANRPDSESEDQASKSSGRKSSGRKSSGRKSSPDKSAPGKSSAGGRKPGRRVIGVLVLIAACWGTLLAVRPTPSGDPVLVSSSPGDSEIVRSPDEVRLTFDQPVPAELATVRMTRPSGEQVVAGRPYHPGGARDTIAVRMPRTRYAGTYLVGWALPSSRLEPIDGTFRFAVFQPTEPVRGPAVATERDSAVVAVHTVARLVAMAGFALGVGVLFVLAAAWPAGSRHRPARRLVVGAWCALVVGTVGTMVSFGGHVAWTSLGDAFDPTLLSGTLGSDVGTALVARLLVLIPITVALVRLRSRRPAQRALTRKAAAKAAAAEAGAAGRWWVGGTVLGCAAALAVTWSLARPHAPDEPTLVALGAEALLLLALATGVGGLVVLWLLLRGADDAALPTVVRRVARIMPVCGVLLAISAAAASGWQTVVLIGLAILVAGTGVAAHRWVRRSRHVDDAEALPSRVWLRRLAAGATCAGALALVATSTTGPRDANLALDRTEAAEVL